MFQKLVNPISGPLITQKEVNYIAEASRSEKCGNANVLSGQLLRGEGSGQQT